MGNIFQMPITYLTNAGSEINSLKRAGLKLYAAHPSTTSKDIRSIHFSKKVCIVFGAEGHGVSKHVQELCDEFVTIPMKEGVDSLNVASASAVLLWEILNHK